MRRNTNRLMLRHIAATQATHQETQELPRGRWTVVRDGEQGVLFRHGRVVTVLDAGRHRRFGSGYSLQSVDLRPRIISVPTQEIPTSDGVSVKVSVVARARVVDAARSVTAVRDTDEVLYLAIQVALREVMSATSVDQLLTSRGELGEQLLAAVDGLDELGVTVDRLELRDIVLPVDLRRAQAEVLVARAQAASALERARGETAALRSMANAARLAADNPALLQLRLLQQLEVSAGHTVVVNATPLPA